MFKKILVPVDGSHTSLLGLAEAIKLAKDQNATLYLMHVVEDQVLIQDPSGASAAFVDDILKTLQENARNVIAQAKAMVKRSRVREKSVVVESFSRPADEIVKQAKKLKADLIVLGTHGRRGLTRMVMGSDAEVVVRETPVPVLLVRSSAPAARRSRKRAATKKRGKPTR
jgi:nucleotide-binding universal stress UspA family protein